MKRQILTFVVGFLIMATLVGSVHYYFYRRLLVAPSFGADVTLYGGALCGGLAFFTPTGMVGARLLPRRIGRPLGHVAYVWLGTLWMLLSALGISEIARQALRGTVPEPDLSRWITAVTLTLVLLGVATGLRSALGAVPVKRVPIGLKRLPPSLAGYRMVQLSDLHIGPTLGRAWAEQLVARVNELDPHAVVITGDLVDGSVARLREHVAPLADLRARDGVFFVTGNHEYYAGADAWLAELERLGVRPLRNERVELGSGETTFDLAGVDDWQAFGHGHGPDLAKALEGRDPARELVLLAHQPRQIHQAAELGVGLQLSGHTHGGQIAPWNVFVRLQQPYISGLSWHRGTQIYVSCGTGFWGPPLRVLAPAEITLLELSPAPPVR